jgi:hypothetical protein
MKTFEIKLTGSGTLNQVAIGLLELGKELQVAGVYNTEIPKTYEDSIICAEITEVEEDQQRYGEEETRLIKALEHESNERLIEIKRLREIIRADEKELEKYKENFFHLQEPAVNYVKDSQFKCKTKQEVISHLVTLPKKQFVTVIKSGDEYYIETGVPFLRSWETVLAKGSALSVLSTMEYVINNAPEEVKEPETDYSIVPTVDLEKAWESSDAEFLSIEKIRIRLCTKTRVKLMNAMRLCKHNDWWSISVRCDDPVEYLDDEGKEIEDWRTDVEYFIVFSGSIVFYAQHKHNSSCQIESEAFTIDKNLTLKKL